MSDAIRVTQVRDGEFLVEIDGRQHVAHVAGPPDDRWLHWNGQVFRRPFEPVAQPRASSPGSATSAQALTAPMPAKVLKVAVQEGDQVHAGDTLLVLEAMKMELPIRADADGVVRVVACRPGELVQAGAVLVELA